MRTDERVAQWFADHRTPRLDEPRLVGSMDGRDATSRSCSRPSSPASCWRSGGAGGSRRCWWSPLVLEAAGVHHRSRSSSSRPRPDVPRLDESPVDSSRSRPGTSAAAACYGAIVVVVLWRSRHVWWPVLAGRARRRRQRHRRRWARMYRGMHFLSDVIAGFLLGAGVRRDRVVDPRPRARRVPGGDAATRRGSERRRSRSSSSPCVAAGVAFALSLSRAVDVDPVDPAAEERAVSRAIQRRPRLRRFLASASTARRPAACCSRWPSPSCSASRSSSALVFDMVDEGTGLARLDALGGRVGRRPRRVVGHRRHALDHPPRRARSS